MRNLRKILSWILVILWMIFIFYLSHQQATDSNDLSTGITEMIIKAVEGIAPGVEFDIDGFYHIVSR